MAGRSRLQPGRLAGPLILLASIALALGACSGMGGRSDPPGAGRTVLPREIGVRAAIAAGERALESRGYTIERDEATADKGAVVGVGQALRWPEIPPRVRIEARLSPGGVELTVTRTPPRRADADLDLVNEIRARLGLSS